MVEVEIELSCEDYEFLKKENIDLNEYVRDEIKKLMDESKNK